MMKMNLEPGPLIMSVNHVIEMASWYSILFVRKINRKKGGLGGGGRYGDRIQKHHLVATPCGFDTA